jgi:hypothetical protein
MSSLCTASLSRRALAPQHQSLRQAPGLSLRRLWRGSLAAMPVRSGASLYTGGAAGVHTRAGFLDRFVHSQSFVPAELVRQLVHPLKFFMKALMNAAQMKVPLYGRLEGPAVAPTRLVEYCKTYREAVRVAWTYRRIHYMTRSQLASEGGFYYQHVGDWLNPDDKPKRRDLPGDCIKAFEALVGNSIVSQWIALQAQLTVLEEAIATRNAA